MRQSVKSLSRVAFLLAAAASVSGCTAWIEEGFVQSSRAIDCAIASTAPAAPASLTADCATHPAAG